MRQVGSLPSRAFRARLGVRSDRLGRRWGGARLREARAARSTEAPVEANGRSGTAGHLDLGRGHGDDGSLADLARLRAPEGDRPRSSFTRPPPTTAAGDSRRWRRWWTALAGRARQSCWSRAIRPGASRRIDGSPAAFVQQAARLEAGSPGAGFRAAGGSCSTSNLICCRGGAQRPTAPAAEYDRFLPVCAAQPRTRPALRSGTPSRSGTAGLRWPGSRWKTGSPGGVRRRRRHGLSQPCRRRPGAGRAGAGGGARQGRPVLVAVETICVDPPRVSFCGSRAAQLTAALDRVLERSFRIRAGLRRAGGSQVIAGWASLEATAR